MNKVPGKTARGFLWVSHSGTFINQMPRYRKDEKYWDMQKNTTSQSNDCLTFYIYTHTHFYLQKALCSRGPCRQAEEGEAAHTPNPPLPEHVNTYGRSGLVFISSRNQTFRLQGSLSQRKKLPKATQPSLISRRKGCGAEWTQG